MSDERPDRSDWYDLLILLIVLGLIVSGLALVLGHAG